MSTRLGSQFQNAIDSATRRTHGVHYTSEADILKLIRPLFLDALRCEFAEVAAQCCRLREAECRRLREFHAKLSRLTFLDPACGCGNFLVLTYIELRRLELDIIAAIQKIDASESPPTTPVNLGQFFGIELDAAAIKVAETAMREAEQQLDSEMQSRYPNWQRPQNTSPATLVNANALRVDWNDILPSSRCSYVFGNPPFVGGKHQSRVQRDDARNVLAHIKHQAILDYVACWFVAATEYIQKTSACVAFVATNSITQGEQVGVLWSHLFRRGIEIDFAYRPFVWETSTSGDAHVHCVIVGFSCDEAPLRGDLSASPSARPRPRWAATVLVREIQTVLSIVAPAKTIFASNGDTVVAHRAKRINRYLVDGPDVEIVARSRPRCDNVPAMRFGNQPIDGGNFILTASERRELLRNYPAARQYLRRYIGADEFLSGGQRWCLWLDGVDAKTVRAIPPIAERVERVRAFRLESKRLATRELAATATTFAFVSHPEQRYLLVPAVSSARRDYIPIGFVAATTIASNACLIVAGATHFHFGVLTSAMHMAWTRHVCGRLKSDLRYSAKIVYNNFPWPRSVAKNQHDKIHDEIVASARDVIRIRRTFGKKPLAELYDPQTMPPSLSAAHRELDRNVELAYRTEPFASDEERLAFLMEMIVPEPV
ncbi:MAG: class I SAM-dependent DNA methyltransferase [Thermoguttaceae bacterium]